MFCQAGRHQAIQAKSSDEWFMSQAAEQHACRGCQVRLEGNSPVSQMAMMAVATAFTVWYQPSMKLLLLLTNLNLLHSPMKFRQCTDPSPFLTWQHPHEEDIQLCCPLGHPGSP